MKGKIPYFINLLKSPTFSQMKGLETTVLTGLYGEKMMMVLNSTLPGCTVPIHTHPHEQVGMVYQGEAIMIVGKEKKHVKKGDFYCIPSKVPHGDSCISKEPFIMFDIFYPVRKDFIKKIGK